MYHHFIFHSKPIMSKQGEPDDSLLNRHKVTCWAVKGSSHSKIFCACGSHPSPRYRHQDQPHRAVFTQEHLCFKESVIFTPSMNTVHDILTLNIWCRYLKCIQKMNVNIMHEITNAKAARTAQLPH